MSSEEDLASDRQTDRAINGGIDIMSQVKEEDVLYIYAARCYVKAAWPYTL